jgi:hypothetical protein
MVSKTIEEVQGIFPSDAALQDAISRLTLAGVDRADLSLPQTRPATADATPEGGAADPNTDVDNRQMRTMHASMAGSIGALAAAGVAVASGGTLVPVIAAAAVAGVGAGLVTEAGSHASDAAQSEERDQAAREGRLVLSVRTDGSARQEELAAIMRAAGASRVEPVRRVDNAISSAGWTG